MNRVMILGGYGHFGVKISEALLKSQIPVIIVGRHFDKLNNMVELLKQKYPADLIFGSCFDIYEDLNDKLRELKTQHCYTHQWAFSKSKLHHSPIVHRKSGTLYRYC